MATREENPGHGGGHGGQQASNITAGTYMWVVDSFVGVCVSPEWEVPLPLPSHAMKIQILEAMDRGAGSAYSRSLAP